MRIPPEEQGTGMAKGVIRDMVAPIESLGGGKARVSTAWLGKYAWLKLGLEPSAFATGTALKEYRSDLKRILGDAHPAVDMSMARIQNTQHLPKPPLRYKFVNTSPTLTCPKSSLRKSFPSCGRPGKRNA